MQNIGNKLIKKNKAGQITELYRITSSLLNYAL